MKTITIVSGKGGVGKSTISASIVHLLSSRFGKEKVLAVDCDVDAADLHLLLGEGRIVEEYEIESSEKATVDYEKCIACGKCNVCRFNALILVDNRPVIDKYACEGCGACSILCPTNAITLSPVKNAVVRVMDTDYSILITGQLKMGESGSGKVVTELKNKAVEVAKSMDSPSEYIIRDSAAGISCPVIASINGSDYVVVVTEPTPTGLFDLKRVISIVERFNIPYGVVINKHDANPALTERIENEYKGLVLTKIPYNKKVVDAAVNRIPLTRLYPEFKEPIRTVIEKITSLQK